MPKHRQQKYVQTRRAEGRCTQCGNLGQIIRDKAGKVTRLPDGQVGRRAKCGKHLKAERELKGRQKKKAGQRVNSR